MVIKMPRFSFFGNVCSRTNTIPLQENKAGIVFGKVAFNPAVYKYGTFLMN